MQRQTNFSNKVISQALRQSIEIAKVNRRLRDWKVFCGSCGVAQTSADESAGRCTNCSAPLAQTNRRAG